MKKTKRPVWQISGGPSNRSYAEVFIKYGVGLIGPGDSGLWKPGMADEEFDGGFVRRFATEVDKGDIILLRTGIASVRAIGLVASDYIYLSQFDDVNGWDLQHGRRVLWSQLPHDYTFDKPVFGANPSRLSRIGNEAVIDYAERFIQSPPNYWQSAALPALPEEDPDLQDIPRVIEDIVARVHDLMPLYWDRMAFGEHPTEDEIVSHYVIPFLMCLGWPVERIGVKWRYIDVAVFKQLPRSGENCQFVIEAKRLGSGVEGALDQAKGYLESLGVMRDVIVTDGVRYRMFSADKDFAPVAYANLSRLKKPALELFSRLKNS